ncbi:MAG: nucleotidyltransferase domain-containing protein [Thermodesulfobacteriota bacterium]|nr:nucleotidyltransferase domain-containing protein [Thermodesulfobacteriota bacterium]
MKLLPQILSSKARAEIFRLLFGLREKELHVREMERQSGLCIGTVRQELQKLVHLELLSARRDGNRLYYQANKEHPLYPDICSLVRKTSGLVEVLKGALDKKGVRVAFVFGSVAVGQEDAESDVDLMVIGEVTLRTVSGWLSGISEEIGREINPHVMNTEEFRKRIHSGEHFLGRVLKSPRLFVVGNENELEAMGG